MRVDGVGQRLDRGFGFHRQHAFADQLEGFRPDDVDAQNFAIFRIGDNLHEAIVLPQDTGLAIGGEGKLADPDVVALPRAPAPQ